MTFKKVMADHEYSWHLFSGKPDSVFFSLGVIILLHVSVVLVILHVLLVTFLFIEAYSL